VEPAGFEFQSGQRGVWNASRHLSIATLTIPERPEATDHVEAPEPQQPPALAVVGEDGDPAMVRAECR